MIIMWLYLYQLTEAGDYDAGVHCNPFFVSISAKFGICTVVGHLLKLIYKQVLLKLIYKQVSQVRILAFNKCPI